MILHDFLIEFAIWFWVVENLGSRHPVSVVRVIENNRRGNEKKESQKIFGNHVVHSTIQARRKV